MRLRELALLIDAQIFPDAGAKDPEVRQVYAADTMSELIDHASSDTLLVTSLRNNQLIRVAELMDAPGICLVDGTEPGPELLSRSSAAGAVLMVSPRSLKETRARIEACLSEREAEKA